MDCGQGVDTQHQRLNETLPAGSCKLPRTQVTQVFLIMNMNVLKKLKAIKECYSRVLLAGVYPAVELKKNTVRDCIYQHCITQCEGLIAFSLAHIQYSTEEVFIVKKLYFLLLKIYKITLKTRLMILSDMWDSKLPFD